MFICLESNYLGINGIVYNVLEIEKSLLLYSIFMTLPKIKFLLTWIVGIILITYIIGFLVSAIASRKNNFVTTRYLGQHIDNSSGVVIKKEELEGFLTMYTQGAPGPYRLLQRLIVQRVEILDAPEVNKSELVRCGIFIVNEYTIFNIPIRENVRVSVNFCS